VRRLAVLVSLLATAPAAHAADFQKSPLLWATVNVCDTERYANTIGVRASMQGSRRRGETMWMRFRLQYMDLDDNSWHNFSSTEGTDSGYIRVARHARYRARQAGYLFPFEPQIGDRYILRGAVEFQWRKRGRVMRNAREMTTKGHRTSFSDPPGYSAATCEIVG